MAVSTTSTPTNLNLWRPLTTRRLTTEFLRHTRVVWCGAESLCVPRPAFRDVTLDQVLTDGTLSRIE